MSKQQSKKAKQLQESNQSKKAQPQNTQKQQNKQKQQKISGEQYFSAEPSSIDERRTLHVTLRDNDVTVQVSNGVFSASRLDLGTSVLLKHAPELPKSGKFLDIGCGWGPISLAFGLESPEAEVFAIDVNERALELTELNAKNAGLKHIHTSLVDDALKEENNSKENNTLEFNNFDIIWSNPPIRVGKEILHNILLTWIPRLKVGGKAYLVVQKNLGSDSLITWLAENLGESYSVEKYASSKGYRVIEVKRN
ncbi:MULTISPECIES: class I SAM-dependent methyltransferase [Gardnerella]|uniref:class I SAM-dependent methyltransferase n=1 Tax=Gardnerella TaxID=2701 RepID=UPI000E30D2BC|nr:methyltransferase [Gardnerella vaginalis]MBF9308490.1 methyltransferase [Bifidobacteriaceae bacterium NR043]MBF9353182.1 methyltransferase [Bifidobacteriaceae bacterium NR044]RFT41010.1 16S rRNA methyltransferase [Bifidobacteriaceae bacterium NR003]